jgi:hypothetical protein
MTLSIMTFSIMTLSIKGLYVTLSITMLCHYAVRRFIQYYTQRHYADCRSAECRGATTMHFWSGQKLKSTTLMRSSEST